jgi:hypothetical protein
VATPALWAAYLQLTRDSASHGGETERHQWVFIPPVDVDIAPSHPLSGFSYYHRHQEKLSQKTVWKHHSGRSIQVITAAVDSRLLDGWSADPMITCEVAAFELAELANTNWKTPYRLLTRLKRVSEATHRYTI